MQAWESGCKGITVYREGSREGILITEEQQKKKEQEQQKKEERAAEELMWKRDVVLSGQTMKVTLPNGSPMYLTANFDSTSIREVFINLGKTGSEEKSYAEAIGRLISKYLQQGGDVREVIESLPLFFLLLLHKVKRIPARIPCKSVDKREGCAFHS